MTSSISRLLGVISPRAAALCAAALVMSSYFFPLWGYSIYAPQYPEGLYMTIWADHLGGDIRNVNILNHYVGMKAIESANFPELRIAPVALGFFVLLAVILAFFPLNPLFWIWIAAFLVGGVAGGWDLARWSYDFGTQLNPLAPIKVPGMHFIPPLIGKKTMLNITSYSYPHLGSAFLGLAFLFMFSVVAPSLLRKKKISSALALVFLVLPGCLSRDDPEPIHFGSDTCAHCRMIISDSRFGGEIIMKGGKIHKFDSLECVRAFSEFNKDVVDKVFFLDFHSPGKFVGSEEARLVRAASIRGPMGQDHLVSNSRSMEKLRGESPQVVDWRQYKKQAEAREPPAGSAR